MCDVALWGPAIASNHEWQACNVAVGVGSDFFEQRFVEPLLDPE